VPVLHALYSHGLPTHTFIRDAITGVQQLGWSSWIVTPSVQAYDPGPVPRERVITPASQRPVVDRIGCRLSIACGRDEARERSARTYLAALSAAPPGIVHAHFGWTAADCVLASRRLGLPLIVSFHGTDLTVSAQEPQWARYYTRALAQASGVTVVSRFLEGRLRSLGYRRRVDLVPSGVRLADFPFSGAPVPGRHPRLLFVGRLISVKGADVLLAALAHLRTNRLEAELRVVGDGPDRAELEAATRSLGIAAAVRFQGTRNHDDVRRALLESDIVIVPSRVMPDGQAEGSSVVAKEAQAIGRPLVATSVGGIPETVRPDLRDELVPPDRPDLLAASIARLWAERAHWPVRVRAQRDWIAKEFASENTAMRLSSLYDDVIARNPPSAAPVARLIRRPSSHRAHSRRRGAVR
jgi:colanic acid/amylovoran biosynthesis glycosyltransferase